MAISLRLNTRWGTTIATATRLPRSARNDRLKRVRVRAQIRYTEIESECSPYNQQSYRSHRSRPPIRATVTYLLSLRAVVAARRSVADVQRPQNGQKEPMD